MQVTEEHVPENTRRRLTDFVDWIKLVGEGQISGISLGEGYEPNWIRIPEEFLIKKNDRPLQQLIDATYLDLHRKFKDISYLNERAILALKNTNVDEINSIMLLMLLGDMRTFLSVDKLCPTDGGNDRQDINPPEFLHSMNFPGFPTHCLQPKVGTPVILLRNINQSLGLCNGTRLIINTMGDKVIEVTVITGLMSSEIVFINRVDLSPSTTHSPFAIKRRQFPIKLAFAMTINKSHGQTLNLVGLYLPNPVFSHGQLYVALSGVTSTLGLKVLIINKEGIPEGFTKNVVYREVFMDIGQRDLVFCLW